MATTYFVTGASGQLGQLVVLALLERGERVIAGTRSPERLNELKQQGVEVRKCDFHDPAGLVEAMSGAERGLLISTDAIGARLAPQIQAVQAAKEAGLKHLVYTSVVSADVKGMAISEEHIGTENAIKESFASYTILRNNLYAELVIGAIGPALATGQLVTARENGRIAWVSREDCARAAASALSDGFEGTRVLDITGPEALSGDDMAALFSELGGREVKHVSIPAEALIEGMVTNAGLPRPLAETLAAFDVSASQGLLERVSASVKELTGQEGKQLRDVLLAHREAWS